jgi:putative DNA primase/helicase
VELARFDLNDYGNAMRFIRQTGGWIDEDGGLDLTASRVLYLRNRGWIAFNGRHWDLDHGGGLARREAAKVALQLHAQLAIRVEAAEGGKASAKTIQAIWDFACSRQQRPGLGPAEHGAELPRGGDRGLRHRAAGDQLPQRGGAAGPRRHRQGRGAVPPGHEPGDRMTRMVDADYDPDAAAPKFRQLAIDAQPKPDDRHYLQKVLGYCSTGSVQEQKFWIFQGRGGDGKSTVVNAVRDTLGGYATVVAVETFLDTGPRRGFRGLARHRRPRRGHPVHERR